jgi:hypothetical protein
MPQFLFAKSPFIDPLNRGIGKLLPFAYKNDAFSLLTTSKIDIYGYIFYFNTDFMLKITLLASIIGPGFFDYLLKRAGKSIVSLLPWM